MTQRHIVGMVLSMLTFCVQAGVAGKPAARTFHKGPALSSTRPSETKSLRTIGRFGPVGMGIDLLQPPL